MLVDMGDVIDGEAGGHGGMSSSLGDAGAGGHGGCHQQWVVMVMVVMCVCVPGGLLVVDMVVEVVGDLVVAVHGGVW